MGNECQKYLKTMSEYTGLCQVDLNVSPTFEMQSSKAYYSKGNCMGQSKPLSCAVQSRIRRELATK